MGGQSIDGDGDGAPFGNSMSFEQIYGNFAVQLQRFITSRVGTDLGEDLTSQVFLEAWAHRDRFDARRGDVRAWMFGIATNLINRHYRGEQRRRRAYARSAEVPSEVFEEDHIDRLAAQESRRAVAEALMGLRPVDRDLFRLYANSNVTYTELAEVAAIPVGTVRSRLSRARQQLQAAMDSADESTML
jgi:RNA polymerase sigma-70 factor (ECF subfamily)